MKETVNERKNDAIVLQTSSIDEFDAILNENPNTLVVIDFYATWCGPCKIMGPKFHKLSNEYTSVVFVKVDVDESEDIVSRFDIKVMPTFIFMRKGAQIDIVEGSVEDDLRKKIEQHK
ncbi:putative thioredoxin [Oesophagostomum dentatum]|uniref:Thioredoxin n=1 Tax=Oesophagostomum dentatum TaxID=61180 RepID=A0A0B1TAM7_OESDE|nr:putative thioredoxin [Oesophagostomum dentatum]